MNLKKFASLGFVGISVLILSACSLPYGSQSQNTGSTASSPSSQNTQSTSSGKTEETKGTAVKFADGVVTPAIVTVKSGGSITWVNNGTSTIKVGSDPHPTHTANKEITGGEFVIELAPGESETVTVSKTGTWGFHDHAKPTTKGSVVVQ